MAEKTLDIIDNLFVLPKGLSPTPQQNVLIKELKEKLFNQLRSQNANFSEHTYESYFKHSVHFILWCEKNHNAKTIDECRAYVEPWIQYDIDRGLSAHSIKLRAAAVAKVYGCKMSDFDIKTPTRSRTAVRRSRGEAVDDKHFSILENRDLIRFCRCTGLHRSELEHIRGDDLRGAGSNYSFLVTKSPIGGKERMAPVIGTAEEIAAIVVQAKIAGAEKIFDSIPVKADIQGYRIEYAHRIYNKHKQGFNKIKNTRLIVHNRCVVDTYTTPNGIKDPSKYPNIYVSESNGGKEPILKPGWDDLSAVYYCRKEFRRFALDRAALIKTAKALGVKSEADVAYVYFSTEDAEKYGIQKILI